MIDWTDIHNFTAEEFGDDPNINTDQSIITALERFRQLLDSPIYPSPVNGSLWRIDSKSRTKRSQHYAGEGRVSVAVDVFTQIDPRYAFMQAIMSGLFGGVGLYTSTQYNNKPHNMLHLDTRDKKSNPIIWVKDQRSYTYLNYSNNTQFFSKLSYKGNNDE